MLTYKSGTIVIPDGLCIAIRFKNGIGIDNTILQVSFLFLRSIIALLLDLSGTKNGKVGDDLLGVLRFASTRLSCDQHGLILRLVHHTLVGTFSYSKEMRRNLIPTLANVHLDHTIGVDGISLVGVDDNTEETRISL